MHGRISLLHAAIVSSADQLARLIENGSTDGNAAFFEAKARFRKSNREHGVVVQYGSHAFSRSGVRRDLGSGTRLSARRGANGHSQPRPAPHGSPRFLREARIEPSSGDLRILTLILEVWSQETIATKTA